MIHFECLLHVATLEYGGGGVRMIQEEYENVLPEYSAQHHHFFAKIYLSVR